MSAVCPLSKSTSKGEVMACGVSGFVGGDDMVRVVADVLVSEGDRRDDAEPAFSRYSTMKKLWSWSRSGKNVVEMYLWKRENEEDGHGSVGA